MMSGKTARRSMLYFALAAVCSLQMSCGSGTHGDSVVGSKQGTVNVEGLKVGVPEGIIKDAVLTFVLDESQAAKAGGRNQYLSRTKDSKGGQYSAQCKDGNCFRLEAIYETPITKEQAMATLKNMLPTSADEPKLRENDQKNADQGIEKYDCGGTYVGEFTLIEPKSDKVRLVAAIDRSKLKKDEAGGEAKKADDAAKTDDKAADDKAETPKAEGEAKTE